MRRAFLLLLSISCLNACNPKKETNLHMDTQALAEIDAVIKKVFEAICFDATSGPNMHRLKDVFIDEGILINYNDDLPLILPVDDFVTHFEKLFEEGIIPSLEDKEVKHTTEIYDRVAHRFSFYEARFKPEDAPFAQGVNSIQLIHTSEGWKLTSMAWNDDNRGNGFFQRAMNR